MATIWDVLGIEPTTDEREIRRAYARELKLRRPDKDPQGFQALREAFDSAKRYASSTRETLWIDARDTVLVDEPGPEFIEEDTPPSTQAEVPEEGWNRNELWQQAQAFAALLVRDETTGFGELHHYLEQEIPDSLTAGKTFSLMLAEALSEQPWLYRSLLNEVSSIMGWQIDNYRSSQLPDWLIHALDVQIANTEQENYWLILSRQYDGGMLAQLKWRLLTEKGAGIPWWAWLVPDFIQQLRNQVIEVRQRFPLLQERLNPALLEAVDKPRLVLSWETIITVVFWGYTAWLPGHESLKMAAHAVAMLGVVALYLWGYPALMRLCRQHPGRLERVESYFWLISLVILFSPFYKLFHHLYYLDNKASSGLTRVLMVAAILLVPLGFTLWEKRSRWRTLPQSIVKTIIVFPVKVIRDLPPLVNVLAAILLPMLYGIIIEMVYFIK